MRMASVIPAGVLIATILASGRCASPSTAAPATRPGAFFVNNGCVGCHVVSVYGLKNPAATGPDLSIAVEDVPRRFGRPLEDFLHSPVGTMQIVLSTRIKLTDEEKQAALDELHAAYALYVLRGG